MMNGTENPKGLNLLGKVVVSRFWSRPCTEAKENLMTTPFIHFRALLPLLTDIFLDKIENSLSLSLS